jgi:hypothetical protein
MCYSTIVGGYHPPLLTVQKKQNRTHNLGTHIETFALFIEENPFEKGFP